MEYMKQVEEAEGLLPPALQRSPHHSGQLFYSRGAGVSFSFSVRKAARAEGGYAGMGNDWDRDANLICLQDKESEGPDGPKFRKTEEKA